MDSSVLLGSGLIVERGVRAPMRDGAVLRADVYRPDTIEQLPVLLLRTPYDRQFAQTYVFAHPAWYAMRGYAVVVQDTRGSFESEGDFYPLSCEAADGFDSIEWCAQLPFANGKVGTYGFSYPGLMQMLAASLDPPHLVAACPAFFPERLDEGCVFSGGAFSLAFNESWAILVGMYQAQRLGDFRAARRLREAAHDLPRLYASLPLNDFTPLRETGYGSHFFDYLAHQDDPEFWRDLGLVGRFSAINVPCLHIGGWYDSFLKGTLKSFQELSSRDGTEHRLIVGPWYHAPWARFTGGLDFGPGADNSIDEYQIAWFDAWLKGKRDRLESYPRIQTFAMGANRWVGADSWPPPATPQTYFLHSEGRANSLSGNGRLSHIPPTEQPPDFFVYDPAEPVPSRGGHSCCYPDIAPMGPADQRPIEIRNDVLVYTTEPLERPLEVNGWITGLLWAATTAMDTDFVMKVCDVNGSGLSINIASGVVRARYRCRGIASDLLEPGVVYGFDVDLGATHHVFQPGHCIRILVSSSDFPAYDRNPNTGAPVGEGTENEFVVATQSVFHTSRYPSRVTLPAVKSLA